MTSGANIFKLKLKHKIINPLIQGVSENYHHPIGSCVKKLFENHDERFVYRSIKPFHGVEMWVTLFVTWQLTALTYPHHYFFTGQHIKCINIFNFCIFQWTVCLQSHPQTKNQKTTKLMVCCTKWKQIVWLTTHIWSLRFWSYEIWQKLVRS